MDVQVLAKTVADYGFAYVITIADGDRIHTSPVQPTLGADVGVASAAGADGLIDDDVAYVTPWGFDVAGIAAPVLLVHGGQDRVVPSGHSEWLLRNCADAELWLRPRESHISILDAAPLAMDWLHAAH